MTSFDEDNRLKIHFIIPFKRMSGGIRVVYIYAKYLTEMGHDVTCYLPAVSYPGKNQNWLFRFKASVSNVIKKENWFDNNFPIKVVPVIKDCFIPDGDIVIATAWQTAYDVAKLSESKGKKFYFVQGYEVFNGERRKVEGSYDLGIPIITITKELARIIQKRTKRVSVIYNGLYKNEFLYGPKKTNEVLTIIIMFHEMPEKGTQFALDVISEVRKKIPVRVIVFGRKIDTLGIDGVEIYEDPERELLIDLYRQADIYLFTSRVDAWGLTALEAMANRCAVIGNNIGALHELSNGKNCVIVDKAEEYISTLLQLNDDRDKLKKIQDEGYLTAEGLIWENSQKQFLETITHQNYEMGEMNDYL